MLWRCPAAEGMHAPMDDLEALSDHCTQLSAQRGHATTSAECQPDHSCRQLLPEIEDPRLDCCLFVRIAQELELGSQRVLNAQDALCLAIGAVLAVAHRIDLATELLIHQAVVILAARATQSFGVAIGCVRLHSLQGAGHVHVMAIALVRPSAPSRFITIAAFASTTNTFVGPTSSSRNCSSPPSSTAPDAQEAASTLLVSSYLRCRTNNVGRGAPSGRAGPGAPQQCSTKPLHLACKHCNNASP